MNIYIQYMTYVHIYGTQTPTPHPRLSSSSSSSSSVLATVRATSLTVECELSIRIYHSPITQRYCCCFCKYTWLPTSRPILAFSFCPPRLPKHGKNIMPEFNKSLCFKKTKKKRKSIAAHNIYVSVSVIVSVSESESVLVVCCL